MSAIGVLVALTLAAVAGAAIAVSGAIQPVPSLERVIEHLERRPDVAGRERRSRPVRPVVRLLRAEPRLAPSDAELRLVGRSIEQHALHLLLGVTVGSAAPMLVVGILQRLDALGLGWYAPALVALLGGALGGLAVHTSTVDRATAVRADLRYQTSAYLDVVTMLLAGNTGYESALDQAAHAGDGRLFAELRRRMREAGTRGSSLVEALRRTGHDLAIEELEQVAATAALSAAEGAPVARTLAAKCATLRAALATEQESEARLRTSRLTTPIVGMALIFMGLVVYPALSFP